MNFIAFTWKQPGKYMEFCVTREVGNPASVLTHFEIFITKLCMKVPGIWHKKTWENLEFRTKNLEKTWNLVFGKMWEPCLYVHVLLFCRWWHLQSSHTFFSFD